MSREVVADGCEEAPEGYKRVQIGPKTLQVPEEWPIRRFGDCFHRRNDSLDSESRESIRYIGLKHLESGRIHIQGYDKSGKERSSDRAFRKGDILFGKLRPNLEKAAVAPFDGICSSDIIPIYSGKDVEDGFLPYLMHSKLIRDRAISTMEGTNLPRTSWQDLDVTKVPLPSLLEQRRIVDILSSVDNQIQRMDKIIEETNDLSEGLFNDLLTNGIKEDGRTIEVQIGPRKTKVPKSWDTKKMSDILADEGGAIRTGPFGSKLKNEHHVSEGVKLYEQRHVYQEDFEIGDRHVTEEWYNSELTSYGAQPLDVLITLQGTVGEAAMIPESAEEGVINPKLIRIRADDSIVLPQYLARFLDDSRIANQQIESLSHGAVVKGLTVKTVKQIKVLIPPTAEQKKIVNIVNTVNRKLSILNNYKRTLQELKRGLMQDLLTGKVRVDDINLNQGETSTDE